MPLKEGSEFVVNLYQRTYTTSQRYQQTGIPGAICGPEVLENPAGKLCLVLGEYVSYDGMCFKCSEVTSHTDTEVLELKDTVGNLIHKRATFTFKLNYSGAGVYQSQVRTWGVENVINPGNPTRAGYTFLGWFTEESGGTQISFPFLATDTSTLYHAHWDLNAITATPGLFQQQGGSGPLSWNEVRARNNDAATATVLMNATNPPTTNRGDISSGGYTPWYSVTQLGVSFTWYATAQAAGKQKSAVASITGGGGVVGPLD